MSVSAGSGMITVRLPRAIAAATQAGYCSDEFLEKLAAAGANGKLSHHFIHKVDIFTDPLNAAGLKTIEKTGSSLWYSALVFIDHLLEAGVVEPGCRVCEVGAGCGAVGLALHFMKGCRVTLTDQPQQLPLLFLNAGHNAHRLHRQPAACMPTIESLPWGDAAAATRVLTQAPGGGFDLIVGSDVTYDPAGHDALLSTLAILANSRGGSGGESEVYSLQGERSSAARVLIAAPDWRQPGQTTSSFLRDGFLDRAARLGWRWEVLHTASQNDRAWLDGSSKSTACPVVILCGKAPPLPRRSRVSHCFDDEVDPLDARLDDDQRGRDWCSVTDTVSNEAAAAVAVQ